MAWRASGSSNAELVANLKSIKSIFVFKKLITCFYFFHTEHHIIQSARVEQAMLKVDRGNFSKHDHYADAPSSIGYGATISAPHMVIIIFRLKMFDCINHLYTYLVACICT